MGYTYGKLQLRASANVLREHFVPQRHWELTRNHIPSIQCIIVLDEAEAIHELDLGNVSSTILEVVLDVFLGDCGSGGQRVLSDMFKLPVGDGYSIKESFRNQR